MTATERKSRHRNPRNQKTVHKNRLSSGSHASSQLTQSKVGESRDNVTPECDALRGSRHQRSRTSHGRRACCRGDLEKIGAQAAGKVNAGLAASLESQTLGVLNSPLRRRRKSAVNSEPRGIDFNEPNRGIASGSRTVSMVALDFISRRTRTSRQLRVKDAACGLPIGLLSRSANGLRARCRDERTGLDLRNDFAAPLG